MLNPRSVLTSFLCFAALLYGLKTVQIPLEPEKQDYCTLKTEHLLVPVDHFNATDTRTYYNRYWVDSTFYMAGGPVFFYDAGERGVSTSSVSVLSSIPHPVTKLAQRFYGLTVVWEHRFYGQSFPVPLNTSATQEQREASYRYLDTEQALEDAVFFATHFHPQGLEEYWDHLKPSEAPWIWIGASYPGQRAAMIRKRNPDIFWAAWSSSAPVQDVLDFPQYYSHISRDLPVLCRRTIQQAVCYCDKVMTEGSTIEQWKLRWRIAKRWSNQTFWARMSFTVFGTDFHVAQHLTSAVAYDWQWAGMEGRMNATCDSLHRALVAGEVGTNAIVDAVLDAVEANIEYFKRRYGEPQYPLDRQSWQYQVCTEYPYLRTADAMSEYSILSSVLTLEDVWTNACARQYPWLSHLPNVIVPSKYAGWDKNVSSVMWTTGLRDPWHELSVVPTASLVPGAPNRTATTRVPACGKPLQEDKVFGLVFEEGRHGGDLTAGSKEAQEAVALFEEALKVWLPCFQSRER